MTRVRPGTRLVVFVSGFGCKSYCKSFVGVLEVVGDWVKASSKIGDWSHVVEVKPIAWVGLSLVPWLASCPSSGIGGVLPRPCTPSIRLTPRPCPCHLRMPS